MKKLVYLLFIIPQLIYAEELKEVTSDNYQFKIEQGVTIDDNIIKLSEEFNSSLNTVLRLKNNNTLREVIILHNKESYTDYLKDLGVSSRDDYIYIKYSNKRSKVVLYQSDKISPISLKHHLALQYIDHYCNGSPYWLSLGIALYLEDMTQTRWITSLRRSNDVKRIFTSLKKSNQEDTKPYYAWLVVDYLLNSDNKEYNRLFWDTLSYLKYSADKNKEEVVTANFSSYNLDKNLYNYLESINGYEDYMNSGIELYQNKQYSNAIEEFKQAQLLEPKHYSPEYYMGLCFSNMGNYTEAYSHFSISLDNGAPKDTVYYSIGINFFAAEDFKQTERYLNKLEDEMYQKMAGEILDEIKKY